MGGGSWGGGGGGGGGKVEVGLEWSRVAGGIGLKEVLEWTGNKKGTQTAYVVKLPERLKYSKPFRCRRVFIFETMAIAFVTRDDER